MNITYNGLQQPSNLITFTDIPNILKVEDSSGGTRALLSIEFSGDLKSQTSVDGQWYITFLGETISSVVDPANAVNKNFYVSTSPISTAASVARAFRNCPTIAANFTVENTDELVDLRARSVGTVWSGMRNFFTTNITNTYLTNSASDGSANSQLVGAMVNVDVSVDGEYITTLTKNYSGSECAFNVSPVLTTVASHGKTVPYSFSLSYTKNGEYNYIGDVNANHIIPGYMCNQGGKYLSLGSNIIVAQNFARGTARALANNTILYLYGDTIPFTFYRNGSNVVSFTISYKNSALEQIGSSSVSYTDSGTDNKLKYISLPLSRNFLDRSFYVDVIVGSTTVRYNVIKPLKATEYYQRICWRNSYGGISFFDFTGARSETRDVEVSTYQKNIFGYYSDSMNELEKVYDNDVDYKVTLKSHLFENDGKYIFNDIAQSSEAWTIINGQTYAIIIDSVSVDELDRNDIYEATLKYHYSQKPSLI